MYIPENIKVSYHSCGNCGNLVKIEEPIFWNMSETECKNCKSKITTTYKSKKYERNKRHYK